MKALPFPSVRPSLAIWSRPVANAQLIVLAVSVAYSFILISLI